MSVIRNQTPAHASCTASQCEWLYKTFCSAGLSQFVPSNADAVCIQMGTKHRDGYITISQKTAEEMTTLRSQHGLQAALHNTRVA